MDNSHEYSLWSQPWLRNLSALGNFQTIFLGIVFACGYLLVQSRRLRARTCSLDFSNIKPLPCFNVEKTEPHRYRPWKAGKYNMTMGIRKMPEEDWLIIDNKYEEEQNIRTRLLESNPEGVMQVLPAAEEACEEALDCIVSFLTKRYPSHFQYLVDKPGYIHNKITNRMLKVTKPYEQHPLAVAAQLMMEDINLLIQGSGQDARNYYLQATFSMAPAGWYISERIGWPLWKIHGPVPIWDVKLRTAMEKFFLGLKVSSPLQRNNFFIQTNDIMFQQEPFADSLPSPPKIEDIHARHERQTLRRLPRTRAVMFLVRTYLTPMTDLLEERDSLSSLRSAIEAWPEEMARYKGRHVWAEVFRTWYDEVLGDYVPDEMGEKSTGMPAE